ncbi:MAG: tetratricopeptide repeat protein, partial [Longimicrobiales bacterium]
MTGRRAAAGVLLGFVASGCVYLNSLYNARQRFEDGERARIEGRADDARIAYDDAIRKASASFRKEPEGRWADDALYVLGRAYLRRGDYARALGALEQAADRADDPSVAAGARLYIGAALAQVGDRPRARRLLDDAVVALAGDDLAGEAHYWRGRLLLAVGRVDDGLRDLTRAEQVDARLHIPVEFERLAWGIEADDTVRAVRAAAGLLADPVAGLLADSIGALVERAARRWGPGPAAALLAPTRTGDWPPGPRDRLLMQRVALLAEA